MPLLLDDFRNAFDHSVLQNKMDWRVGGFYGCDGKIYPLGTDTKVLSTIFEALCAPIVYGIAQANGYEVYSSPQTVYPDFTLKPKDRSDQLIAVDIKTTYRKTSTSPFVFTLGSYTSFLRDGKKNILRPYAMYAEHWVIGFVYTRRVGTEAKVYVLNDPKSITCPYEKVEYFVQEKYKIGGLRPASGNTANLGSFATSDIRELSSGAGPFARHGKEIFDDYWRNYPRRNDLWRYSTIEEFLAWRKQKGGSKAV